jgi:signal transduction histidine kinase
VIAEQEIRTELAETLQDELGQQLAGTLLAAGALFTRLARRHAPEESEAAYLLDMLKNANRELDSLIVRLDEGKRR